MLIGGWSEETRDNEEEAGQVNRMSPRNVPLTDGKGCVSGGSCTVECLCLNVGNNHCGNVYGVQISLSPVSSNIHKCYRNSLFSPHPSFNSY